MIRLTKKEKRLLALTSIVYMINAALVLCTVYYIAKVLECAELGQTNRLPIAILTATGVIALEKISSLGMTAMNQWYTSEGELSVRRNIMKNILWRPLQSFRRQTDAYYMNIFETDSPMYREYCLASYPWIGYFILYLIVSIIMLWTLSPVLAIVVIALSWIPFLADKLVAKLIEKRKKQYSEKNEAYTNVLKETLEGYETIRMGNGRDAFLQRSNEKNAQMRYAGARMTFANAISREASSSAARLLQLIALAIGAVLVMRGHIRAAMLYAVIDYSTAVSNSFSNFAYYMMAIRSTKSITEKLTSEFSYPVEETALKKSTSAPLLEYDSVSFSFEERPLYQNFSCRFEPGKCYAIIGESGSGKSTLMKLFLKYYDSYSGTIRLNGKDIRELSGE